MQKFKNNAKIQGFKLKFLRKIVNNRWAHNQRELFHVWRNFAHKEEIVQICNQNGKVRQHTNKILGDIMNMKDKLQKVEYYEPEEIAAIIKEDDEKY